VKQIIWKVNKVIHLKGKRERYKVNNLKKWTFKKLSAFFAEIDKLRNIGKREIPFVAERAGIEEEILSLSYLVQSSWEMA
jgi:hypothetical protein